MTLDIWPTISSQAQQTTGKNSLKIKEKGGFWIQILRPNIEGLVMKGEHAQQDLLHRPFGSIMTDYELIVPQIPRQ